MHTILEGPHVIFRTPGIINLRAFTTLGAHAKPNATNPIGYFGTGLKYATAVILRNQHELLLGRGNTLYEFKTANEDFRNKTLDIIKLRQLYAPVGTPEHELPFTLELGKDWELWQAFRELYANTLDENGYVEAIAPGESREFDLDNASTQIIVRGEEFYDIYQNYEEIFLPDALTAKEHESAADIQYFLRPSKYVYYRGMRVMDLEKPSAVTYNILKPIDLTEDRTAKYTWSIKNDIADFVMRNSEDPDLIKAVVTAGKECFESGFDFTDTYSAPSEAFAVIARDLAAQHLGTTAEPRKRVNSTAINKLNQHDPEWRKARMEEHIWLERIIDWLESPEEHTNDDDHMMLQLMFSNSDALVQILRDHWHRVESNL